MNKQFITPFGDFELRRIPDNDKNLFAWNAADHYLLKHLFDLHQSETINLKKSRILIVNDAFGALTIPLARFFCDCYSDSFVSHQAIMNNLKQEDEALLEKVTLIKSTDQLSGYYDVVLFKLPKNQLFLQIQMYTIAQHLTDNVLVLGSVMARHLQKNSVTLLNKTIGETQVSLAWKKSRLLFIKADKNLLTRIEKKIQTLSVSTFQLAESHEVIYNHANVFSANKLDIGSRFFLQHLPGDKDYQHIIDLGCGNGVLALKIARQYPQASLCCIDESYSAIASAKKTLSENLRPVPGDIRYLAADALSDYAAESADLILCNPPFHQQYVIGDAIAWKMFQQAKKTLIKGGELWIVGNRHLAYHLKLKKIFGHVQQIASNNKFVILKAIKR